MPFHKLRVPVPFSLLSFLSIHLCFYLIWLALVGSRVWSPAWPVIRTQLALFMLSLPTWALTMSCYGLSKRRRSRHGYSLIGAQPQDYSFTTRRILGFFLLFLLGTTIITTYSNRGDLRYLRAVNTMHGINGKSALSQKELY